MNSQQIANIITDQIRALDRSAFLYWGTRDMQVIDKGLCFKTSGLVRWKGFVSIVLNHNDFYDICFFKIRKHQKQVVKQLNDVFCGDLVELIDAQVG